MVTEREVKEALRTIWTHRGEKALNYAVRYAEIGLGRTGEELRVQVMYVICNLASWRGEIARNTKAILKQYLAENRNI